MSVSVEYIKGKLEKELQAELVEVEDISPDMCGSSFRVLVVAASFEGKSRLQQQRMVNGALAEVMPNIHALTQKTYTPDSWQKQKSNS